MLSPSRVMTPQQKSCPTKAFIAFCVKTQLLFTAKLVENERNQLHEVSPSTGHVNFIHCLMSLMLTSPWVSALSQGKIDPPRRLVPRDPEA